ncbi:MAG: Activator of Hsp90 ATPase 1 family protein [Caulobacter sp.]|nr:Activator of Hsp90 ATPase 1 family protein [Caulobacter sp.]
MTKMPTKSIVVERLMPHPPAKVWRALTQSGLIESWLMKNDFQPVVDHRFTFHATPVPGWSGVTNCKVLEVEPNARLAYAWGDGTESDSGLQTVVTWTIEATDDGSRVRMEHSGFRPQDEGGYKGMGGGWPRIVAGLERVAGEQA